MQNSIKKAVPLLDVVSKYTQTLQNTDGAKTQKQYVFGHHYPQANTTNI